MTPSPTIPSPVEPAAAIALPDVWRAAVGRVYKLITKPYGVRQVTYTHVRAVHEPDADGGFDVEVRCVEIIARVLEGRRAHSNISKEGILRPAVDGGLLPECFGRECRLAEFEKVTEAILAYTNTYLEWVIQDAPEEKTEIEMPIDVPHLPLTAMEASLVRHSPFLAGNAYFLTPISIDAALASIRTEMARASRNIHLADAVDPVYVAEKNAAAAVLKARLEKARGQAATVMRPVRIGAAVQLDSLCLALLGQPSATTLYWVAANPGEEGMIACLGANRDPLEFVRWAHVSGRFVPPEQVSGRELRDFFRGWNNAYTGPDREGIYPLLKLATD
jgi:hypothetical protein